MTPGWLSAAEGYAKVEEQGTQPYTVPPGRGVPSARSIVSFVSVYDGELEHASNCVTSIYVSWLATRPLKDHVREVTRRQLFGRYQPVRGARIAPEEFRGFFL